jgi:exoribonuclease R
MEYKVSIFDNYYETFIFSNEKETLTLSLNDIHNFKTTHFFHNDMVQYDKETKEIKIIKTDIKSKKIIGIVNTSSKTVYGMNHKKQPYYLFTPLEKHYPKFLITLKNINKNSKNHYVLVKYNMWKNKFPLGNMIKDIGIVGNENVEYNKILEYHNINQKKLMLDKKYKVNDKKTIYKYVNDNELENYIDMREKYTISIDPKGCLDIDDALSYEYDGKEHLVYVHISDVSFWIKKFNLEKFISNRFFTLYCPTKKFNVFPNILSDFLLSLRKNKDRLAFTIIFHFDQNYNMVKYEFKNTIINVDVNTTYENAERLVKQDEKCKKMFELMRGNEVHYDTHKMIEKYMLLSNKCVAEFLVKNNKTDTILRIHKEKEMNMNPELDDKRVIDFIKYYQMNCAEYTTYSENKEYNYFHYGLNMNYYTHFTSPIRRVIDIFIHLELKELLFNEPNTLKLDVIEINKEQRKYKIIEREMNKIYLLNNKLEDKEYDGYIINYRENELNIYIPDLKTLYHKKIFHNKLLNNVEFSINEKYIEYKYEDEIIKYNKYQKIKLNIDKFVNDFDVSII